MHSVGITNFSFSHMMNPTFATFKRQLEAVINFIKFREDRLQAYNQLSRVTDDLDAQKKALEAEHKTTMEELAAARKQRENEEAQVKVLDAELRQVILPRVKELNEQRQDLQMQINALASQDKELLDKNVCFFCQNNLCL